MAPGWLFHDQMKSVCAPLRIDFPVPWPPSSHGLSQGFPHSFTRFGSLGCVVKPLGDRPKLDQRPDWETKLTTRALVMDAELLKTKQPKAECVWILRPHRSIPACSVSNDG